MANWIARCQYCGKTGSSHSNSKDTPPIGTPQVYGNCPSHPSGKKDAKHAPKWEKK